MKKQLNRTIASILIVTIVSGCATTTTTATTTPQVASNTEWKLLVTTTDRTEIYVGNVSKLPNTQAAMAVLTNHKQPTPMKLKSGATVITNSTVLDFEYDCNLRSWRNVMGSFWTEQNGKGLKYVDAVPGKWTPVDGNTVASNLYAEACKTTTVQAPSVPTPAPSSATPSVTTSDVGNFIGGTFSVIGDVVGSTFQLLNAVAVPLANGYYTQKNENARNNSGTKSAPNYSCQDLGMGSVSCVAY